MKQNDRIKARLQAHHDQAPVEIWRREIKVPGVTTPRGRRKFGYRTRRTVGETEAQTQAAQEAFQEDGWIFDTLIRPGRAKL